MSAEQLLAEPPKNEAHEDGWPSSASERSKFSGQISLNHGVRGRNLGKRGPQPCHVPAPVPKHSRECSDFKKLETENQEVKEGNKVIKSLPYESFHSNGFHPHSGEMAVAAPGGYAIGQKKEVHLLG